VKLSVEIDDKLALQMMPLAALLLDAHAAGRKPFQAQLETIVRQYRDEPAALATCAVVLAHCLCLIARAAAGDRLTRVTASVTEALTADLVRASLRSESAGTGNEPPDGPRAA